MPELPEVETVRCQLATRLDGATIREVVIWNSGREKPIGSSFVRAVVGQRIVAIERRAKLLIWRLSDGNAVMAHLKMTGKFIFVSDTHIPEKHDHILFRFSTGSSFRTSIHLVWADMRKFGFLHVVDSSALQTILGAYGPEPLETATERLAECFTSPTTRSVKSALLNQSVIAGVGNIYADEACFRAKLHPRRRLGSLSPDDRQRLAYSIQEVLRESLARKGTSARQYVDTTGLRGTFKDFLQVYGRSKQPCRLCQTPIQRIVVAQRGTHVCPVCQR